MAVDLVAGSPTGGDLEAGSPTGGDHLAGSPTGSDHLAESLSSADLSAGSLSQVDLLAASPTLVDLLDESLEVIFVGINPSLFSASRGHYFARPGNRFWPCFSRSTLSRAARAAIGSDVLGPEHDRPLLRYGFGFTDVAKRATARASEVDPAELASGVQSLVAKFEQYRPRIACFHGVTGYRAVHRFLGGADGEIHLGLQELRIGNTRLYLVPNPSGANAHYTRDDQTRWYDRLYACVNGNSL